MANTDNLSRAWRETHDASEQVQEALAAWMVSGIGSTAERKTLMDAADLLRSKDGELKDRVAEMHRQIFDDRKPSRAITEKVYG